MSFLEVIITLVSTEDAIEFNSVMYYSLKIFDSFPDVQMNVKVMPSVFHVNMKCCNTVDSA